MKRSIMIIALIASYGWAFHPALACFMQPLPFEPMSSWSDVVVLGTARLGIGIDQRNDSIVDIENTVVGAYPAKTYAISPDNFPGGAACGRGPTVGKGAKVAIYLQRSGRWLVLQGWLELSHARKVDRRVDRTSTNLRRSMATAATPRH